jgi:hypothetical protein
VVPLTAVVEHRWCRSGGHGGGGTPVVPLRWSRRWWNTGGAAPVVTAVVAPMMVLAATPAG